MTDWSGRNWLITGSSAGFGLEAVQAILARGGRVAAATRSPDKLAELAASYPEALYPLGIDVGDSGSIAAGMTQLVRAFGQIDVLLNNAGYGLLGAAEETSDAEARALFDVNFFGATAMVQAVLPQMRARRSGYIVTISSISGLVGSPGSPFYAATKHALEGFSDALGAECAPLGIDVMTVQPGAFRTNFYDAGRPMAAGRIADYANVESRRSSPHERPGAQSGDPALGVAAIISAMESEAPPKRLILGDQAVRRAAGIYRKRLAEIDTWQTLSLSADGPPTDKA